MPVSANTQGRVDRIGVGVIGFGSMCESPPYLRFFKDMALTNNITLVGASDLLPASFASPLYRWNDIPFVDDYHRLLENPEIDAIIVATHDSLHAQICLDALDARKHIYCETPTTRYLEEAFALHDRVKQSGKVFQSAVPSCSAGGWRACGSLIQQGAIGTLSRSEATYLRNSFGGEWNYPLESKDAPDPRDWKKWLGPIKQRPLSLEEFYHWRKYYPYSAGPLGHLGSKRLSPLLVASGNPEFPIRVNCISSHRVDSDSLARFPKRTVPGHVLVQAEFPSGHALSFTCGTVSSRGAKFSLHGHLGTIELQGSGDSLTLIPEAGVAPKSVREKFQKFQSEDVILHLNDWFACIRSGGKPAADIDLATKVQTIISLAEMSDRLRVTCLFDPATRQITDCSGRRIQPLTYGFLD